MSDADPTNQAAGSASGQTQPGWYPDPGTGQLRWWDGLQWGQFQQAAGGVPAAVTDASGIPAPAKSSAALAHYLGVLGFIGPLIIMMTNSTNDPFVKDQSTEALNFHLTVLIGWLVLGVIGVVTCGFGMLLFPFLWIGEIIYSIVGGQAASKGQWYRYPVNIRMVK
jgi:uncharacterized protein